MSSLLSTYDSEFQTTIQQCKTLLQQAASEPLPERNSTLKSIEQHKDELFDILDQMDVEVNNSVSDPQQRATLKARLRDFRKDLNSVKQTLQELVDTRNRDSLLSSHSPSLEDDQRQQLLSSHAILQRSGSKLVDATRLANETEDVGNQIMSDLRMQRETLENTRQNLFQADAYIDKSVRTLKSMSRRLVANKFISYAIIAVLILLILLVLYSKFN
ncbi:HER154Cp [Eremothecium sinecaudum]|uniref:HER154Cp n=1 Tax=Eremothecium sinecaudum TaxID=45286 RepID=A0A109UZQ8_9SACH|nr:HER154Cp [Eremothecium sinecaudum]AMD21433.1 HER154Cp [Eremothecium sinecaudum]